MTQLVVNQPRIAWDCARAFVRAAESPGYDAFAAAVHARLGPTCYGELATTRYRLLTEQLAATIDGPLGEAEVGIWRVRLDDLMRARPDLVGAVQELSGLAPRRP
jgi:hypothetical protein